MNNTKTNLTHLLTERLSLWDKIDDAYDKGLVVRAVSLQETVNVITKEIRDGYGL